MIVIVSSPSLRNPGLCFFGFVLLLLLFCFFLGGGAARPSSSMHFSLCCTNLCILYCDLLQKGEESGRFRVRPGNKAGS